MIVRPTQASDISALQAVLEATELFSGEMLPEMMSGYLSGRGKQDTWLSLEDAGAVVGFCYAAPEKLTDGTWNMLAIAVAPSKQGSGYGRALVSALERSLRGQSQRILIADTSGTEEFGSTRAFYHSLGFTEEARIRDFWADGADKITFWKRL